MNNFRLMVGMLAFFLGAIGLYICSMGDTVLGVFIMIATLIGTFLTMQDKKRNANKSNGKKKNKKKNRKR